MTQVTGDIRRFHEERLEQIRQHSFLVVPDDDCEEQNGMQHDFEDWRKGKLTDLQLTGDDTLESLFSKTVGVYSEAEQRRFMLTNILEGLKRGGDAGKLSSILNQYRDVGVGDVERRTPQPPSPETPPSPAPAAGPQVAQAEEGPAPEKTRGFGNWIGKKIKGAKEWAGKRSYEFVTGLLEHLKKLVGELILMVMNALKGFAVQYGLELQAGVETGATGPTFGFNVTITKDLDLDVINIIMDGICKIRRD